MADENFQESSQNIDIIQDPSPRIHDPYQANLQQPSLENLLCIPSNYIRKLEAKIQSACSSPELFTPAVLKVAQIKLSFLLAKESVQVWGEGGQDVSSCRIFTVVQDYFVKLMVMFMNTCPAFQSLPTECKAGLLR